MLVSDITDEQQKILDKKYEDAMMALKSIDSKLYNRLRANEKIGFEKNVDIILNEQEQFEMRL
jgi:hypothetical protein